MNEDTSGTASGSQTQVPPAQQVTTEVDDLVVTSASAIAPHTEESLAEAIRGTDAPSDEGGDEAPAAEEDIAAPPERDRYVSEPPTPPQTPPKKKQSAKERHDEIQARIDAATRELREVERRTIALREEAQRLSAPPPPKAEEPQPPPKRPRWKDYEAEGKTYQDYEEDLATWDETRDQRNQQVVEQRLREQRQIEDERYAEQAFQSRIAEKRAQHQDFEVARKNLEDVPQTPFLVSIVKGHPRGADIYYDFGQRPEVAKAWGEYDTTDGLRPTRPIFSALHNSANPSAMLEYLATHREEYAQITRMPPVNALLALGQLETALAGAKNGSPARSISHAAAPLSHRAGSQNSGPPTSFDDESIEEYVRVMNKREGRPSPV